MSKEVTLSPQVDVWSMIAFHANCASHSPAIALERVKTGDSRVISLPPYKTASLLWELTDGKHGLHVLHQKLDNARREAFIALIDNARNTDDPNLMHDAVYVAVIALANVANNNTAGERFMAQRAFPQDFERWYKALFGDKASEGIKSEFLVHPTRYAETEARKAKNIMLKAQVMDDAPAADPTLPQIEPVAQVTHRSDTPEATAGNSKNRQNRK